MAARLRQVEVTTAGFLSAAGRTMSKIRHGDIPGVRNC